MKVLGNASELHPSERVCTFCKKPLIGKLRWLELDQRIHAYHDFGDVPPNQSQGWFAFGLTCAKKLVVSAQMIRDGKFKMVKP